MQDFQPVAQTQYLGVQDASDAPETIVFVAPCPCRIVAAWFADNTAQAAHDTNYGTYAIINKGVGGAGTDIIATKNTTIATGAAIVANVPLAMTLGTTKSLLQLAAGQALTFKAVEAGAATSGDLVQCAVCVAYVPGYSSV